MILDPGTKKGKLDQMPVWIVQIRMLKELIRTIYSGYEIEQDYNRKNCKQRSSR